MRISLVFPPFYHESMYNLPPLGLIRLSSMLQGTPHSSCIIDQVLAIRNGQLPKSREIYRKAADQILDSAPDLVAFSAQCTTYPPILQIARYLKMARPTLNIVIGGHNASFLATQTLERFEDIDFVIRGEGERTFLELVETLANNHPLEQINGLSWRQGSKITVNADRDLIDDLNELPLPDYQAVSPLEVYRQACALPRRIAILEIGRGCPHHCVYCSEAALWQRRTRTYGIPRILEEMRILRDVHGAECFLLAYDQFTADSTFVETFCQSVMEAGLHKTPWYCISRLDTVDAKTLSLMRQAGCESMCYGIDSGSERTLAFIRKQIKRDILFARVRETTEVGLVPTLSFVIGFPEETQADIDATLNLALQCGIQGNSNPLIQIPTVLPGTDLHRRYLDRLTREVDTYFALGIEFDNGFRLADDEQLINQDPEMFSSFYNLPCPALPLFELHRIATSFPLIVNLFPRTFLLVCQAFGSSPAVMFLQFYRKVMTKESGRSELTAPDCYRYFPSFIRRKIDNLERVGVWPHLRDILHYELSAVEVAEFASLEKSGTIDLCRLKHWKPHQPANVKVSAFDHDLPCVIEDLKNGVFKRTYPAKPTWLAFRQEGNTLVVTEINDFGRDFLACSRGEATLAEIASQLQQEYGKAMATNDFLAACQKAAEELTELQLLIPSREQTTQKRR